MLIVTRHLANRLFPAGDALGQIVYFTPQNAARIVGIVEHIQSPYVGYQEDNSSFEPVQYLDNQLFYLVRTRPGQQAQVMRTAPQKFMS